MPLAGVALVTGGSRRIGRAIVERLAADGWQVVIHYHRSAGECEQLAAQVRASGGTAYLVGADLSDDCAGPAIMAAAVRQAGPLTALVNNAALFDADAWDSVNPASFHRHMAVNCWAPIALTQAFARQLPHDSPGAVVNVLDQRVWRPTPDFLSYTTAKSALWSATQSLAIALAPRIRVNAVGPGPVLRSIHQSDEDFVREYSQSPLMRPVTPGEVADAVAWLLRSASVTGQLIAVDAGQHL